MRHLIDPADFTLEETLSLMDLADRIHDDPAAYKDVAARKRLATLFYEPSTRTRLSFEAAMLNLGGQVLGFPDAGVSSASKGETVADTIRVISCVADIAAMRHPKEGAPLRASRYSRIPVINAGDGGHSHPTQTLLDMMTIRQRKGHLDHLPIGFCGDLKFGRTVHSLMNAMSRYAGVLSVDPMTQIAIYQQEQTALIQTMAQDLNGSFTDRMEEVITSAAAPIQKSLQEFVEVNTQQQLRLIDKVAGRFVERMDGMLDGQFKNLSRVIETTCESQKKASELVGQSMNEAGRVLKNAAHLQNGLETMVAQLDDALKKFNAAREGADDNYLRIASNVEKMELVATQQNAYLKSVSSMHAELSRAMQDLQQAQKNMLQRFSEVSGESTASLLKAAGEIRATGAMLENNRQRIGEQLRVDLTDTLDAFRDYMAEFTKRVDYLAKNIADSLGQLPQAVGETADAFLDQVDRLGATLEEANAAINDAVDRLYPPQAEERQ